MILATCVIVSRKIACRFILFQKPELCNEQCSISTFVSRLTYAGMFNVREKTDGNKKHINKTEKKYKGLFPFFVFYNKEVIVYLCNVA